MSQEPICPGFEARWQYEPEADASISGICYNSKHKHFATYDEHEVKIW